LSLALAPPLRRVLDRLRADPAPIALADLARRLLALREAPAGSLARRLVASAVGCRAEWLPDPIDVRALPGLAEGPVAAMPLAEAEWIVVDLETTGLSAERCTILEIGAVRIRALRIEERFQTLVDPGVPIPAFVTALTGIDRSLIDGAPPLGIAMRAFHAWVGPAPAVFVAHNAAFDERFVRRALRLHALPPWSGPVVCTRRLARRLAPELPRYDLDSLAARFGIANPARHRALGDAEAAARALLELLEIGRERHGLRSLGDLLVLHDAAPGARRSRRGRAGTFPGRPQSSGGAPGAFGADPMG
jgi:DNA polymerase III epsilon subunit family exonuclease